MLPLTVARLGLTPAGLLPPEPTAGLDRHARPLRRMGPAERPPPLPANGTFRHAVRSAAMVNQAKVGSALRALERLPAPDEALHLVLSRAFQMWHMVPAALQLARQPATEAYFATLSINIHNVRQLFALYDRGQLGAIHFALSCLFPATNGHIWRDLTEGLTARGQPHGIALVHAKVTGLRFADGSTLTIEGSGNLRNCASIEQYTLYGSPELYAFHRRWITEIAAAAARPKPPPEDR